MVSPSLDGFSSEAGVAAVSLTGAGADRMAEKLIFGGCVVGVAAVESEEAEAAEEPPRPPRAGSHLHSELSATELRPYAPSNSGLKKSCCCCFHDQIR